MVMEAANFRPGYYLTDLRWLDCSGMWAIHLEGKMRAKAVIVGDIRRELALEMPFVEDDDLIEHLAPDTPDEPLAGGILPGTARGSFDFFDAHGLEALLERPNGDRVPT